MNLKDIYTNNKKNIIILGAVIVVVIAIIGFASSLPSTSSEKVLEIVTTTSSIQIEETKTYQVKYIILPDSAADATLTWTSTDETVATVDQAGLITAIKPGSAVIVAKAESKAYANIDVVVVEENKITTTVTFNIENFDLKINTSRNLYFLFEPSEVSYSSVTWESSNDLVATVSKNGVVTGVKVGKAVISATIKLKDGNYMSTSSNVNVTKATTLSLSKGNSINVKNGATGVYYLTVSDKNVSVKQIAASEENINIIQIIRRPIVNDEDSTISFIVKGMGIGETKINFDMETSDGEVVSLSVPVNVQK